MAIACVECEGDEVGITQHCLAQVVSDQTDDLPLSGASTALLIALQDRKLHLIVPSLDIMLIGRPINNAYLAPWSLEPLWFATFFIDTRFSGVHLQFRIAFAFRSVLI